MHLCCGARSERNPRSVPVPNQTRSVANAVHRGELGVGATSTGTWSYKGAAVFARDVYAAPYDGSFVLRFHQPNQTIEMIQVTESARAHSHYSSKQVL